MTVSSNQCEAADHACKQWGHKCIRNRHGRDIKHICACSHEWQEPYDPEQV